jgi:hypothetical protein
MILSHSKRFIFVHIYKTGGQSLRKAMERYDHKYNTLVAIRSLVRNGPFVDESIVPKHAGILEIKQKLDPEIFNSYHKFSTVRNPFDWQVSLYHYVLRQKKNLHPHYSIIKGLKDFDEYVEWRVEEDPVNQASLLTDESGQILVDQILKLENIHDDFDLLCKKLDIHDVSLPHLNKTNRNKYQQYYNPTTRKLMEEAYAQDLELFEYTF